MKCVCGGDLVAESTAIRFQRSLDIAKNILRSSLRKPKSKKKRIIKKWKKRVDRLTMQIALASLPILGRPVFTCSACGKIDGFYSAMGRNMIVVEPLPLPSQLYLSDE